MSWDIFICHASEDKDSFVRPLAKYLRDNKIKVWYDEFTISLGQSLREKIDEGIKKSRYGLVVLSRSFIEKEWTKKELNGLFSKEIIEKNNVILPIWLDLGIEDVFNFSPILSDKMALTFSSNEIYKIGNQIISIIKQNTISFEEEKTKIEIFYNLNKFDIENKFNEIDYRLNRILNYFNEINSIQIPKKLFREENEVEFEKFYTPLVENIENKYNFPLGLWLEAEIDEDEIKNIKSCLKKWLKGKMTLKECDEYYFDLDFLINIDLAYIFFDIPNFSYLNEIIDIKEHFYKIGTRNII